VFPENKYHEHFPRCALVHSSFNQRKALQSDGYAKGNTWLHSLAGCCFSRNNCNIQSKKKQKRANSEKTEFWKTQEPLSCLLAIILQGILLTGNAYLVHQEPSEDLQGRTECAYLKVLFYIFQM
jgi:hypothetical protein